MPLPRRLSTGLLALDKALSGGVRPGDLVLLHGAAGSGKTHCLHHLALNARMKGLLPDELFISDPERSDIWRGLARSSHETGAMEHAGAAIEGGARLAIFDAYHMHYNAGREGLMRLKTYLLNHHAVGFVSIQTRRTREEVPAPPNFSNHVADVVLYVARSRDGVYTVSVQKNRDSKAEGHGQFRLVLDHGVPTVVEHLPPIPKEKIPTVWDILMDRAP